MVERRSREKEIKYVKIVSDGPAHLLCIYASMAHSEWSVHNELSRVSRVPPHNASSPTGACCCIPALNTH